MTIHRPRNDDCPDASEVVSLYGPDSMSDEQILSVLLSDLAPSPSDILSKHSFHSLLGMGPIELLALGLSLQDSARVMVLNEIQRRSTRTTQARITTPRSAADYLTPKASGLQVERFGLLCLNAKGLVIGDLLLSQGTASGTLISPREVYREALRCGAVSIIVWHNHPSGDRTPSRCDTSLTQRIRVAGSQLGIYLADHLILTGGHEIDSWYSFRVEEGWDHQEAPFLNSTSQEEHP